MQKTELGKNCVLELIQSNAQSICRVNKPATLLSIDMDTSYSGVLSAKFKELYADFMKKARKHIEIIHIWHENDWRGRSVLHGNKVGQTRPYTTEDDFLELYEPELSPFPGEKTLGKRQQSAFLKTDLARQINPKNPLFITGGIGVSKDNPEEYKCIDSTILDALRYDFKVVAIPDLIIGGFGHRDYPDFGHIPHTHSQIIIDSLNRLSLEAS